MIIPTYKEKGVTSFQKVFEIRRNLSRERGVKKVKVGHAGTLDPLAEGLLIILTDEDTKRQSEFMAMKKEYIAEISFGASSPSHDLGSELTFSILCPRDNIKLSVEKAMPDFIGEIDQVPPVYSAKKQDGATMYNMARRGTATDADMLSHKVNIYDIEILDFFDKYIEGKLLPTIKLKIECGKGTYIRSIARDLGERIGCKAVLSALTRTKIGEYSL